MPENRHNGGSGNPPNIHPQPRSFALRITDAIPKMLEDDATSIDLNGGTNRTQARTSWINDWVAVLGRNYTEFNTTIYQGTETYQAAAERIIGEFVDRLYTICQNGNPALEGKRVRHLGAADPSATRQLVVSTLQPLDTNLPSPNADKVANGIHHDLKKDQERHNAILEEILGRRRLGTASQSDQRGIDNFRTFNVASTRGTERLTADFARPLAYNMDNTEYVRRDIGDLVALTDAMEYAVEFKVGHTRPGQLVDETDLSVFDVDNFVYDVDREGFGTRDKTAWASRARSTARDLYKQMITGLLNPLEQDDLRPAAPGNLTVDKIQRIASTAKITKEAAKDLRDLYEQMIVNEDDLTQYGNNITGLTVLLHSIARSPQEVDSFYTKHFDSRLFEDADRQDIRHVWSNMLQWEATRQIYPVLNNAENWQDLQGQNDRKTRLHAILTYLDQPANQVHRESVPKGLYDAREADITSIQQQAEQLYNDLQGI